MVTLLIMVFVLIALIIVFNPIFDQVPLTYNHERWLILWYNKLCFKDKKVGLRRTWTKVFCIEK